ncbi:hypothetical protein SUGI_0197730 [Cryptomeria japonica]|uniref:gibberellin 2-beta-dioxygenase 8 n=1 Tax=Cryptomeria japonica TaxID=3369 RepID=UPI00240897DA|nr:gibberellin 2-beta-dioxygenase 8 [Cryptomeria japonica]GLJ12786.1 hypothetical protein SUGI_0197730 [Cryptomeria japonica]
MGIAEGGCDNIPPFLVEYKDLFHGLEREESDEKMVSSSSSSLMCELPLIDLSHRQRDMGIAEGGCDNIPPFHVKYKNLLHGLEREDADEKMISSSSSSLMCELPLIDLSHRQGNESERNKCADDMARAASQWGFFQLINHGVPQATINQIQKQQKRAFDLPFEYKLKFGCYRWGTPTAQTAKQLCWTEAFHVPLAANSKEQLQLNEFSSIRMAIEEYGHAMARLAQEVAGILAEKLGAKTEKATSYLRTNYTYNTSVLRLNRYPQCPVSSSVHGLIPHTDSDFLTILQQDQVGGLEIMKDGKWVCVKPEANALIVNIGDLMQAWSNDVYKSVQHRALANNTKQRMSIAFFLCPSQDTVISKHDGDSNPPLYRTFTFRDFKAQISEEVRLNGCKIGLPGFLL